MGWLSTDTHATYNPMAPNRLQQFIIIISSPWEVVPVHLQRGETLSLRLAQVDESS